jgi:hypothetical protein
MKIMTIFKSILILFLIYSWGVGLYIGNSEYINTTTLILLSILIIVLFFFTMIKDYTIRPLFVILIYGTLFWFVLRLLVMITFPSTTKLFPAQVLVRADALNNALIYLIFSTIMVASGFAISKLIKPKRAVDREQFVAPAFITLRRVLILFFIFYFMNVLLEVYYGEGRHWVPSFLTRIINRENLLWIGYFVMFFGFRHKSNNVSRVLFILVLGWSIILGFMGGSRSGLLFVVLLHIIGIALYRKDGFVTKKLIIIFCFVVILAPITFGLASIGSLELRYGGIGNINKKISMIERSSINLELTLQKLALRLSGLDTLAVIINANEDSFIPSQYINFENEIQSIVNTYIIGEPFPDALNTSKAFHVVYQGGDEDIARNKTFTQKWSGYGLMFVKYGWYGGLIATFILAFGLGVIFRKYALSSSIYKDLIGIFLLYIFYDQIMSFGMDEFVITTLHGLLISGGIINIFLLKILHAMEVSIVSDKVRIRKEMNC